MKRLDKIYLGTNTKMYKTIQNSVDFISDLQKYTRDIPRDILELFVLPSYTALDRIRQTADPGLVRYGSQNISWAEEGQYTGEISPVMLRETGAEIVMVGHSERRHILGEGLEEIHKKIVCGLEHGFTVLLCVGETEAQKDQGIADETLRIQLKTAFYELNAVAPGKLWVAYEPVWAIGDHGVPASKEYAEEKHIVIKETLEEIFGKENGEKIPVLYGGSVNLENAAGLIAMDGIDGLFIGRSAWDAKRFNEFIRISLDVWNKRSGMEQWKR